MDFRWTKKREMAALHLAQGYTVAETAEHAKISERTVYYWRRNLEFQAEVDRLSLMTGIATRSERLRIAMRIIRQKTREDGKLRTGRDLLDWLKFAQSETDGAKFDLAAIFEAMEATAGNGEASSEGDSAPSETAIE